MKPTIRDVAKHAGVSVATVSRYLNSSPLIAKASIERVEQSIAELNYQPSMIARGLLHRKTKTVALAVDYDNMETYGNDFFLKIQYGLEHELAKNGYYLMIAHVGTGKNELTYLESMINEDRIDGLVLLNELAQPPVMELLKKADMPFVITGRTASKEVSWVDIDNTEAGFQACSRLLATRACRIGFITNSVDKVFVAERYAGFNKAIENTGCPAENNLFTGYYKFEDVWSYVKSNQNNLYDAYVVSDSMIAFNLLRSLNKLGISVPEKVQVIGFDNDILAECSDPKMTVIDINVTNLGEEAAKILIKQMRANLMAPEQQLLPVSIVEGGTTQEKYRF